MEEESDTILSSPNNDSRSEKIGKIDPAQNKYLNYLEPLTQYFRLVSTPTNYKNEEVFG